MSMATRRSAPLIVLLTGSSLCHNPRAFKEAAALSRAGFQVRVLGAWLDPALKGRDIVLQREAAFEFIPVVDATRDSVADFVRRAGRKTAQLAHDVAGWQSARQLGVTVDPLLREAQRQPADLYIAHSEAGLHAARVLLRQGRRVGVDMEDWFSEDLLPETRAQRPVRLLQEMEREVLRGAVCAFCPSQAMANALAAAYGCPAPTVIYNAFSWSDRETIGDDALCRSARRLPSVYWFSQTLGQGRGIEDLLAALPLMRGACEVHLRGNPVDGFKSRIAAQLPEPWRDRVFLHGLVDNAALLGRIAAHDIGFAGDLTYCRNRDLTVTNKILHDLLGGLAVVASDTAGHNEVSRQAPGAVFLYECGNPGDLAQRLDSLIASPPALAEARDAALRAARDVFCWERQEPALLAAVDRALTAGPGVESRRSARSL
jgi:hypothetical protein